MTCLNSRASSQDVSPEKNQLEVSKSQGTRWCLLTRKLAWVREEEILILFSRRLWLSGPHNWRSVVLSFFTWVSHLQVRHNIVFPSGRGETKRTMLKTSHELGLAWATQPEVPVSSALFLLLKQSRAWEPWDAPVFAAPLPAQQGELLPPRAPRRASRAFSASHLTGKGGFVYAVISLA